MSKKLGESSHTRASESPALYPALASSSRNLTSSDDAKTPTSPVQFCSSASIFNPQIEKVHRNETDLPEPTATPLTLVTLPEDLPPPIQNTGLGRAPKTSIPTKPVKESNMGNIFGNKRKKKKHVRKEEDEDVWKKMDANESALSPPGGKKKDKRKKDKKSKRVESPSPPRGAEGSLKVRDPKRYAMYEPQINPKESENLTVRSRTLPARLDPSEFRKSIGDPMDFRMADDVSPAGSPGQATPETATPPVQKSQVPIYKKIQLTRDKNTDKNLPSTPKGNRKNSTDKPEKTNIDSKVSDTTDKRKPHMMPTPGTGSPRPRGYILPSPPSRPKFHSTEPGSASPRLLRVKPQKPLTLDINGDNSNYSCSDKLVALRTGTRPNAPQPQYSVGLPATFVTHTEDACIRNKRDGSNPSHDAAADIAMQKENEENERNLKREERRKLATVTDAMSAPKLEQCCKIHETLVESIESHVNEVEKYEVTSGPKVAILSTIPPPEKAVLSHVPPPSPSAMDALCEENEEEEEDADSDNQVTKRRSKDVEEFGGRVCQRLSQLLESQDDGTLRLQFVESSDPSSSLSPASPCVLMSGGSDVDKERMEDAEIRFTSLSPPMETENVYKETAISRNVLCVEMSKPSTFSQSLERSSISTRSTQGSNSASDLDGRIDASDVRQRSRDFTRDRPDNESDISSSNEESSYTSDSEYSSNGYDERRDRDIREHEYSIPWDLHRYSHTGSYTSDGIGISDDQLYDESECRHVESAHAQRISRHGLKRGEKVISDCDEFSDNKWDGYSRHKYQRNDGNLNRNQQVSVEELNIEPINLKRQLFQLPSKFCGSENESEIVEDEIRPAYIGPSEHSPSLIPKRGSEMLSDVIDAYTAEELAVIQLKQPMVPPKRQSTVSEEIIIVAPTNPSALDKSLQKIFTKNEEIEEKYPELAPLHSLIIGVEEGGAPSIEPFLDFRPGQLPTFTRVPFGSRRSLAYSESDLDLSEQRDDASSDNMDADDEDDGDGGMMRLEGREAEDGDVVFGRTYTEHENIVHIKVSQKVFNTAFRVSDDNDSVFLDDDSDDSPGRTQKPLSSNGSRVPRRPWTRQKFDIPPPNPEFELPSLPLCEQPPPPPSPSPSPSHVPQPPVDLASTYYAIGPSADVGNVAFDDAKKQMEDIHHQLQALRDQMVHMAEDSPGSPKSNRSRSSESHRDANNTRRVCTD